MTSWRAWATGLSASSSVLRYASIPAMCFTAGRSAPGRRGLTSTGNESGTVSEADAASAAAAVSQHKAARRAKQPKTAGPLEPAPTAVVSAPQPPAEPAKRLAGLSDLREASQGCDGLTASPKGPQPCRDPI